MFFKVFCYIKHLKAKRCPKLEFSTKYEPERDKRLIIWTSTLHQKYQCLIGGSMQVAGLAFTGFKFTLEVV